MPLPVILDIPAAKNLSGIVHTDTNALDVILTECVTGFDSKAFNQTSCTLSIPLAFGHSLAVRFKARLVISSLGVLAIILANSSTSCFLAPSQKLLVFRLRCIGVPVAISLNACPVLPHDAVIPASCSAMLLARSRDL